MGPRSPAPPRSRAASAWLALLLVLTALAPRLAPLRHGLPGGYERDADWPHAALVMLRDKDPAPPRYAHTSEPYLCAYLTMPVFAARYALGRARGEWATSDGFAAHLADHPDEEVLAGRLVAALFGALAPLLLLWLLREGGLTRGAYLAALWLALDPFHVHLSTQARTVAPFVTLLLASALFAARHVRTGRASSLFVATGFAALAHAAREVPTGAVVLGLPGLAWLSGPLRWWGNDLHRRIQLAGGCVTLFVFVAVSFGYPFLVAHPRGPLARVLLGQWLGAFASFTVQGELLVSARGLLHTVDLRAFGALMPAFVSNAPVLVLLALFGALPLLLRSQQRRSFGVILAFGALWAAVYLTHRNGHVADAAPLLVLLAPAVSVSLEGLARVRIGRALTLALLCASLATTTKLVLVSRAADTRTLAAAWLAEGEGLPDGAVVAIDAFGPQPVADEDALERTGRLRERRGQTLNGRETLRLAALRAGELPPGGVDWLDVRDVLALEYWDGPLAGLACRAGRRRAAWVHSLGTPGDYVAWSAGVRHAFVWPGARYRPFSRGGTDRDGAESAATPDPARPPDAHSAARAAHDALRAAGATHVLLCHFGRAGEEPHLLGLGLSQPLRVFEPGTEGPGGVDDAGERRLPFDLESGWLGVWQAERPGPRVEVRPL